nr:PilW family protein [Roseateles oligotrophus]
MPIVLASHARRPSPTSSASTERGFSLIELLVAVAIGLILSVAVLMVQLKLSAQNARTADVSMRDNEARATMDLVSRDLGSAGFLSGATHLSCFATLNYNTAVPAPNYFTSYSVSSLLASSGTSLPFVAPPGLNLNYPPPGSANRSDALVIRLALDGTQFTPSKTPITSIAVNNTYTPMSNGVLPIASNNGFVPGQMGLLQIPLGPPGTPAAPQKRLCIRVPISTVPGPLAGNDNISSVGPQMPAIAYNGFSSQVTALGVASATALTDALIKQGKLTSLGTAAASNQRTYVYFIDTDPARYQWPTLVRASINPLNDLEIPAERQDVGAGVVSLQVLFGIDPGNTGGVTAYQTGPQMLAANSSGWVRSVRLLILTRALYRDKDFSNTQLYPTNVIPLSTMFGAGFQNYTIGAAELNHRFVAQQTEIAVRNPLWQ